MLKRLGLAFAGLFAFVHVACAAGTIPGISMTQQLDKFAKPLAGGFLYLIQAGTTSTPQNCYQDTALTIPYPNPIILDAAGRIPQLFCADGNIKIRLTDVNGVSQIVQDNLLVVGASSGGGGGGTVDPTTILTTGDIKVTYGTGVVTGFVRANGRTIGSATSGATERANSDTQALFLYLWGADANLVVSTGRGISAAADWAANKTIALPDLRGRALAGLDDMGNSAAGRLSLANFGASPTALGSAGGEESHTLSIAEMPAHSHTGSTIPATNIRNATNTGNVDAVTDGSGSTTSQSGTGFNVYPLGAYTVIQLPQTTLSIASQGGGTAHNNMQPTMLATIYLKL